MYMYMYAQAEPVRLVSKFVNLVICILGTDKKGNSLLAFHLLHVYYLKVNQSLKCVFY